MLPTGGKSTGTLRTLISLLGPNVFQKMVKNLLSAFFHIDGKTEQGTTTIAQQTYLVFDQNILLVRGIAKK